LGSFRHGVTRWQWHISAFLSGKCGFALGLNGFDWVRFVAGATSVSIARLVETIPQDRTFSDIFGHRPRRSARPRRLGFLGDFAGVLTSRTSSGRTARPPRKLANGRGRVGQNPSRRRGA
jgi:hypothetical protein